MLIRFSFFPRCSTLPSLPDFLRSNTRDVRSSTFATTFVDDQVSRNTANKRGRTRVQGCWFGCPSKLRGCLDHNCKHFLNCMSHVALRPAFIDLFLESCDGLH